MYKRCQSSILARIANPNGACPIQNAFENLQFGTFGISTYPTRDTFSDLSAQDPPGQSAEAQRDSMVYPVETQPMYPPNSASIPVESKAELQENGGRSHFIKGAGQRNLGDYHNQLAQPSDLSHIQVSTSAQL